MCEKGDLIIADASEDYEDIGKSIEIINTNNEKIVVGLHIIHAKDKNSKFAIGFKGYLFQTAKVKNQIKKNS